MDWTDATSYSQGERGKRTPDGWKANVSGARVIVMCGHRDWRPKWVVTCHELGMDALPLDGVQPGPDHAEAAQRAGLAACLRIAENKVARMRSLRDAFAFHIAHA